MCNTFSPALITVYRNSAESGAQEHVRPSDNQSTGFFKYEDKWCKMNGHLSVEKSKASAFERLLSP